jgi:signal transduction histidine kinase
VALCAAISREVDRLNSLTEEYLRFARAPRSQAGHHDPAELLGTLLDFLAPELAAARLEVRREFQPGVAAIRGDEARLRAVLLNLVRNAREAMAEGGTLTVAVRQAGAVVELEVRDTGAGIAPEALPHLFDPFYSTKARGTGLGLAFVQEVVQEHGGTVRCGAAPGHGASFTIQLPAAPEERPAAAPVPAPPAAVTT